VFLCPLPFTSLSLGWPNVINRLLLKLQISHFTSWETFRIRKGYMLLVLPNGKWLFCPVPHSVTAVTNRCCFGNSGYHQVLLRFRDNPCLIHNRISHHTAQGSAIKLLQTLASLSFRRSERFWVLLGQI
jgi:hypothetical protein